MDARSLVELMDEADVYYSITTSGPLQKLSVTFSRKVRSMSKALEGHAGIDRSSLSQLYRSATSVGANIRESQFAESDKDFIHKLKIAEKELAEFCYWLGLLLSEPPLIVGTSVTEIRHEAEQLRRLLRAIILKKKANLR